MACDVAGENGCSASRCSAQPRFGSMTGSPVRAASAIAPFGSGCLIAQDDANHAAWWREDSITALRLFPPVDGHDLIADEHGTKRLKPDLEAACAVDSDWAPGVLMLGSESLPNRTRVALVTDGRGRPQVATADLTAHDDLVGRALGVPEARRNLKGACVVGDHLRWFQRGARRRGVADASVDVVLAALLDAIAGGADPGRVPLGDVRPTTSARSTSSGTPAGCAARDHGYGGPR